MLLGGVVGVDDRNSAMALSFDDAWEGFTYYVEKLCELQATDPAVADVVSGHCPDAKRLMPACSSWTACAPNPPAAPLPASRPTQQQVHTALASLGDKA
ncbi:hypothetical protein GCM10010252_25600 [Streptomyces aureoverticillatus]|nr:hypothetical protein GCM10010252_25600 [Streptomyces aureoverticillatus]